MLLDILHKIYHKRIVNLFYFSSSFIIYIGLLNKLAVKLFFPTLTSARSWLMASPEPNVKTSIVSTIIVLDYEPDTSSTTLQSVCLISVSLLEIVHNIFHENSIILLVSPLLAWYPTNLHVLTIFCWNYWNLVFTIPECLQNSIKWSLSNTPFKRCVWLIKTILLELLCLSYTTTFIE